MTTTITVPAVAAHQRGDHMNRLAAILALLTCTACSPLVVGDSISYIARPEISAALPDSVNNSSRGRGYYTAGADGPESGIQAIQNGIGMLKPGEWLVIELGTNNLTDGPPLTTWFFTHAMSIVPDTICVAVVTQWWSLNQPAAAAVEAAMKAAMAAQPCRSFVEWDDAVRARPALVYDGVHPTPVGAAVLAQLIKEAVT